jgi:NNP family nitrate/nitrite transporter-like MFS transporter
MLTAAESQAVSASSSVDSAPGRVLLLSTAAFTLMFAVWLMFGVLGIPIRTELGLTDVQFGWLTAVAIFSGSVWRLLFGLWADRCGGRRVGAALVGLTAIPALLVSQASSFPELLGCAFLVGTAGNFFSVGIAWNSAWFPRHRQGFALGVFGAGNVGASVTEFIGPWLITLVPAAGLMVGWVPGGWRLVPALYALLLLLTAVALWRLCPAVDPRPGAGRPLAELLRPLRRVRVWRFSLYYVVVFGAYVALSVWLPKYYVDVYQLPLSQAALLTALFIFAASLLRPVGGWLADVLGARRLMYWVFGTMALALGVLSIPSSHLVLDADAAAGGAGALGMVRFHLGPAAFTGLVFLVGCGMGIGKAAVYKYIPEYFPSDVGAVGGLVGLLGALGGFFLPPLFAYAQRATGVPQTTFGILFMLTVASWAWLHWVVRRLLAQAAPHLAHRFEQQA